MKKILILFFGSLFLFSCASIHMPFLKKKVITVEEKKKETPYEKLLKKEISKTVSNNFITLHKIGDKLYIELPLKSLGKEMLLASTASESNDPSIGVPGYKPLPPLYMKFALRDSTILMQKMNYPLNYEGNNGMQKDRIVKSAIPWDIKKMKIEAWNKDSTAVVFDATEYFIGSYLSPVIREDGFWEIATELHPELSYISDIKAYTNSVSIKSYLSYTYQKRIWFIVGGPPTALTVKATRSIILLPENKMRPRFSDLRIGNYLVNRETVPEDGDQIEKHSYVMRWRLEPKDTNLYKRGELVEPIKPIVFYLDTLTPGLWKEAIYEGAMKWNKAFEKIGFKNAIQIENFPKDRQMFDPDNIEFSCIRYNFANNDLTLGQPWIDPASGEIINATIVLNNGLIKKFAQSRFVETAQVDESVRSAKISDKLLRESIAYEVTYQMGHCLGLLDNKAASAAFPTDSLRSANFTQKHGIVASVMDHVDLNYIAQLGDKGVKLVQSDIGKYDELAIKYAYKVLPDIKSPKEELPVIEHWVDEHVYDPVYRYGRQQIFDPRGSSRQDPSAIEEDLGNDPILASDYGIKNLRYIMEHFNGWIKDSAPSLRQELYSKILDQYYRYLRNVMNNVGGIYLNDVKEGTAIEKHVSVPRTIQKASVEWLIDQMKSSNWLNNEDVFEKTNLSMSPSYNVINAALSMLLQKLRNIVFSAHISENPYSVAEFCDDLFNGAFEATIKNRKLSKEEKIIQKAIANMSGSAATYLPISKKYSSDNLSSFRQDRKTTSMEDVCIDHPEFSGLIYQHSEDLDNLEKEHGEGYLAELLKTEEFGSGDGNTSEYINVKGISDINVNLFQLAMRIKDLFKKRIRTAHSDDVTHYQAILFQLERFTEKHEEYLK